MTIMGKEKDKPDPEEDAHRYRCTTECYHECRLWKPGEILTGPKARVPQNAAGMIRHFTIIDEPASKKSAGEKE